jgi:hypothetical protein
VTAIMRSRRDPVTNEKYDDCLPGEAAAVDPRDARDGAGIADHVWTIGELLA